MIINSKIEVQKSLLTKKAKTICSLTNDQLKKLIEELQYAQKEQEEHVSSHVVPIYDSTNRLSLEFVIYPTKEQIEKEEKETTTPVVPVVPVAPPPEKRTPKEIVITDPIILEELFGYIDNMDNGVQNKVSRFRFWKKIEELHPETEDGGWEYDAEGATDLVIKELLE